MTNKRSPKSETVKIRLDPDEKIAFEETARIAGISLSAWMRQKLRLAAIRELEQASRPIPFVRTRLV